MPSAIKELSVGVRPRFRKSARKPSSEIKIVVGRKFDDPFDRRDEGGGLEFL